MKNFILIAALPVILLSGCAKQSEPLPQPLQVNPMCSTKMMPGGWSESEITPDVQRAINTVMSQMNTASQLKKINTVRTQVVSGINYAIEFTLENGEVWNTVVYKNLRNDYMIERVAKLAPLCP